MIKGITFKKVVIKFRHFADFLFALKNIKVDLYHGKTITFCETSLTKDLDTKHRNFQYKNISNGEVVNTPRTIPEFPEHFLLPFFKTSVTTTKNIQ